MRLSTLWASLTMMTTPSLGDGSLRVAGDRSNYTRMRVGARSLWYEDDRGWSGPVLQEINTLDEAASLAPANTLVACRAKAGEDLDVFGRTKFVAGPIAWALLRSLSVLTPPHSFTRKMLAEGGSVWSAFETTTILSNAVYMIWGLLTMAVGLVWLLLLAFFILPLVGCSAGCGVRNKQHTHKPTGRSVGIINFSVPWGLGFLFTFGFIYYCCWLNADYHAALCTPFKTSTDLLTDGITTDGHYFVGLLPAKRILNGTLEVLEAAEAEAESSPQYDTRVLHARALTNLWAPISAFSSLWDSSDATWTTGNGHSAHLSASQFLLLPLNALVPPLDSSLIASETLLDRTHIYYVYRDALSSYQVDWNGPGVLQTLQSVELDVRDIHDNVIREVTDSLLSIYNSFVPPLNTLLQDEGYAKIAYLCVVLGSCLGLVGLALAALQFVGWIRKLDSPQGVRRRPWSALAGFMVFGYSFWGIILFLVGGGALGVSYFISDVCHVLDDTLAAEDPNLLRSVLGFEPGSEIVEKCLKTGASGDIVPSPTPEQWQPVYSALTDIRKALDTHPVAVSLISHLPSENSRPFVPLLVPRLPTSVSLSDTVVRFFRTGVDFADVQLDAVSAATLRDSDPGWAAWLADNDNTIPGIRQLLESAFAYGFSNCEFCVEPYCALYQPKAMPVSPENVVLLPVSAMQDLIVLGEKYTVINGVARDREMSNWLSRCAADTATEAGMNWWWIFYVATVRSHALYDKWHTQGLAEGLPDLTGNSPLFWRLQDPTAPSRGSKPVTYAEWKTSVEQDVQAILNFHRQAEFAAAISEAALTHTSMGVALEEYEKVRKNFDCKAVSLGFEGIKESVCDSFGGDVVSASIFAVWIGVIHAVAFVMSLVLWLRMQSAAEPEQEETPSSRGSISASSMI
eukprot:Gregarina_sp_Pseudo_9__3505@NODE_366_length_3028_cov_14_047842_g345_i0_p1_GENE_NODE_366_length_3028_cov_14_047842_g345_i0NODE_366_length_3028_cov_14_047842_g345_i0_p1_ORF_typecomplete_len910_score243_14Tweety/PF04906_13/33Tweety/PF04906_13/13Tweety/PF04906_13/2_5_NODE_366_length_3028_cov_14_047842_g345_i0212750